MAVNLEFRAGEPRIFDRLRELVEVFPRRLRQLVRVELEIRQEVELNRGRGFGRLLLLAVGRGSNTEGASLAPGQRALLFEEDLDHIFGGIGRIGVSGSKTGQDASGKSRRRAEREC